VAELINARTELIGSLVASFYAYEDLLTKDSKGLEFYSKLNTNVGKVRQSLNKTSSVSFSFMIIIKYL
jgi:tyrosine-protein phosphatase non-receptor type 23